MATSLQAKEFRGIASATHSVKITSVGMLGL